MQVFLNPVWIGHSLLIIFSLLFLFHILVLVGVVPANIVWAGKIKTRSDLIKMESISLIVLSIIIAVIAHRLGYHQWWINPRYTQVGIWVFFALFLLNTLGNLTATTAFEKYFFGSLTVLISILLFLLATLA